MPHFPIYRVVSTRCKVDLGFMQIFELFDVNNINLVGVIATVDIHEKMNTSNCRPEREGRG